MVIIDHKGPLWSYIEANLVLNDEMIEKNDICDAR